MEWVFSVRCLRDHLEAIRDGWLSSSTRIGLARQARARKAHDWSSARGNAHLRRHPRPNSGCQPRSDRDVSSLGQAAARLTFEPIGARSPRRERWTDTQAPSRSRRLTVRRRRIAVTISFRANSKRVRHLRSSRRARVLSFARAKRLIGPLHLYLSSTRRIWLAVVRFMVGRGLTFGPDTRLVGQAPVASHPTKFEKADHRRDRA